MSFFSDIFKNVAQHTGGSVLGIDVGSSSIKVVQLRRKDGIPVLETYGELALGPYNNSKVGQSTVLPMDKLVEALNDLLKEANTTTKNCGIAIPLVSSFVASIQLPRLPASQINAMVPIEARKYIPVPITEVTMDWFIVPDATDQNQISEDLPNTSQSQTAKKTSVMLVAIHNNVLKQYSEIVSKAGLQAGFFEIEMISTMRSVLDEQVDTAMILDIGASASKIYIVDRGVIQMTHLVMHGGQDISSSIASVFNIDFDQAEKIKRNFGNNQPDVDKNVMRLTMSVIDQILTEANLVLMNFEKHTMKNVSKVICAGGGSEMSGFIDYAKTKIAAEVSAAAPFERVDAPAFLNEILKKTGYSFTVAVGLALRRLQEVN